ncbi:hypothetical protein J6590_047447 [Homalodisca vitripennis]|nr:hypothetical protein J6590_047447 [Homalodisca vitripennis]
MSVPFPIGEVNCKGNMYITVTVRATEELSKTVAMVSRVLLMAGLVCVLVLSTGQAQDSPEEAHPPEPSSSEFSTNDTKPSDMKLCSENSTLPNNPSAE